MVKAYYSWICVIFLSPVQDLLFATSRESLKTALRHRPDTKEEFKKIFKLVKINADLEDLDSYEQEIESETESNKEDDTGDISDESNNLENGSIKENSPFTSFFQKIKEETVRNIVSIQFENLIKLNLF